MSFNDPFSVLFGNGGDSRRNNANNDDPIILDVEADGDGPARNTNAGPSGSSRSPRGPANPRITRKPASGGSGASRGSKVLIGVVLALAIIVGLFFGLSRFITDLMWYGQLGFQSVVWTQLGVKIGLWVAYALLMALTGFVSAWLAIRARPDSADGSTIRINGDVVEVGAAPGAQHANYGVTVQYLEPASVEGVEGGGEGGGGGVVDTRLLDGDVKSPTGYRVRSHPFSSPPAKVCPSIDLLGRAA